MMCLYGFKPECRILLMRHLEICKHFPHLHRALTWFEIKTLVE